MVLGVAGGLMLSGLLAGAISGSVVLLLGGCAAGLLVAGAAAAAQRQSELQVAHRERSFYPPYGY